MRLASRGGAVQAMAMKLGKNDHALVVVTAPDLGTARGIARTVLEARLAACVNLVPRVESHYWWEDRIESSAEVMLFIKTTRPRLEALEECVVTHHPYDTPEFVVLPLDQGSKKYLAWISASVAGGAPAAPKPRPARAGKPS